MSVDLNESVECLRVGKRARNVLEKLGVSTIGDLANKTESELLRTKNCGHGTFVEIRTALNEKELDLLRTEREILMAERIQELEAENTRLRKALENIE